MKKLLSIMFVFSFCFGFAQTKDSLSVEEQQRREKNIQAGNPFKKFGYKPKIHTLSKGKYLEFHDLDSVVKIGSFSYHIKNKIATGYSQEETKYSEATLRPEIVSRWFSPDPLSDEFPSWSPYNFVMNSPIYFNDPTGLAPVPPSTDVTENEDGSYTVVGAKNDGDNNIYVRGADGKRTGEVIGTTMQPTDFMNTNDSTGEFTTHANVTFSLANLSVSGTVKPNEHTEASINGADGQSLLNWGVELFNNELSRLQPSTFYGALEILRDISANGNALDFKASLGLDKYTAISAGNSSDGKPIITTLRAMGNITFGANMRNTKPYLLGTSTWYYNKVMPEVGAYNQKTNNGNGYNSGFPYYGEHTYSGSYIYYGYFGQFNKN